MGLLINFLLLFGLFRLIFVVVIWTFKKKKKTNLGYFLGLKGRRNYRGGQSFVSMGSNSK